MKTVLFTLLFIAHFTTIAQTISSDVISSGGDNYLNNYASMQVTIGEPTTETISKNGIALTQGFQQTDIIVTTLENKNVIPVSIHVYPNPTENLLKLAFSNEITTNVSYVLIDNTGKKLLQSNVTSQITEIPLNNFVSGIYLLQIFSSNKDVNMSFTIEKK